jgi:hypothetical protein
MRSISEHLSPDLCPTLIYLKQSATVYMLLDSVFNRIHMIEQKEVWAERWKSESLTLSAYGNLYVPASLVPVLMIDIAEQLSDKGRSEAKGLITMTDLLTRSLKALQVLNSKESPVPSPFKLAPQWAAIQQIDDCEVGGTPSFGAGFSLNNTVTFNSHSTH